MEGYKNRNVRRTVELACRTCDCRESKNSGYWNGGLSAYELERALEKTTGNKNTMLVRKSNGNGEMIATVPLSALEIFDYVNNFSRIQAKQRLETCSGCESLSKKIADGEIPVKEPFVVK